MGHAIAVLTCQKRAAAPRKPGELMRSPPIRLCDGFALAGIFIDIAVEGALLCCEAELVQLLGGVA
jgi:hypothetical protein